MSHRAAAKDSIDWTLPLASDRIVVLATSAGGLPALIQVLSSLPADFPAAIAVIQHRGDRAPEVLPSLLAAHTQLQVRNACDGELLRAGTVYVCPPGIHMTAEHCIRLVAGPRLAFVRPSADLMLGSVARTYSERGICVVLTGNGKDGARGVAMIEKAGGATVAQDPATSQYSSMPEAAVRSGHTQYVVPLECIAETLQRLMKLMPPIKPLSNPTRVLLADDHKIMRDGLRTLLSSERDLQVVAEANDGHAAVRAAAEVMPDVVVMDVAMPGLDGVEATRQIIAQNSRIRIVALSAHCHDSSSRRILEAGAKSYLCKEAAFTELADAIRSAAATTQPDRPGPHEKSTAR
jgi:two-component system chemotaxis response regulator CheB